MTGFHFTELVPLSLKSSPKKPHSSSTTIQRGEYSVMSAEHEYVTSTKVANTMIVRDPYKLTSVIWDARELWFNSV